MGIDLKELAGYEPGKGGGNSDWFKPKPGGDGSTNRYKLRVLLEPGKGNPLYDAQIHYFRGEQFLSGSCPRMEGQTCPACDMFWNVRNHPRFKDNSKELQPILRKISPQTRVYTNVIVEGSDKVQVWSMPYGVATDLKNVIMTHMEDGIDITDADLGRGIVLGVSKQGAVTKYDGVSVRPKAQAIEIEDWADQLFNLEDMAKQRKLTTEQVIEAINEVLGDDFDELFTMASEVAASKEKKDDKPQAKTSDLGEEV
jgi:hypothetical protein